MKQTLLLPIDRQDIPGSHASLEQAATILRNGGTVAFPTETVYGLGANALSEPAVRKIFAAKQRPDWDPLIVHIAGNAMLQQVAGEVTALERDLMQTYWPGPLTLLLPKRASIPMIVTAGRPKVGVRMPAHPVARSLIALTGLPIAAPSANSFGRISPTTARHVLEDLDGRIDAILDGGPTTLGLESTVLDANRTPPTLYRHGMVTFQDLQCKFSNLVAFDEGLVPRNTAPASLPSPGVGLRHYAPRARLILIEGDPIEETLQKAIKEASEKPTGVLLPGDFRISVPAHVAVECWGRWDHLDELAHQLFAGLRTLDALGVVQIFCPLPKDSGLGAALRDRLQKAAKNS